METKILVRDDIQIRKAQCPKCKTWADIDDDQYHGKVSMLCDCGWHETINLASEEMNRSFNI